MSCLTGSHTVKVLPTPISLSTVISPEKGAREICKVICQTNGHLLQPNNKQRRDKRNTMKREHGLYQSAFFLREAEPSLPPLCASTSCLTRCSPSPVPP